MATGLESQGVVKHKGSTPSPSSMTMTFGNTEILELLEEIVRSKYSISENIKLFLTLDLFAEGISYKPENINLKVVTVNDEEINDMIRSGSNKVETVKSIKKKYPKLSLMNIFQMCKRIRPEWFPTI